LVIPYNVNQAQQSVNIDIKGPVHPMTTRGNQYILVITDVATRWVEAFPMPNQLAETVAKYFVEGFVCRFGCPLEITTDRGTNFASDLLAQVNSVLQVTHRLSTPYSPWVNGCVERVNATVMQILSHYTDSTPETWDDHLYFALYAYRTAQHSVTKTSSYQLMFGREPRGPTEASIEPWKPTKTQGKETANELNALLHSAFNIVRTARLEAAESVDPPSSTSEVFIPGDYVWTKSHSENRSFSEALRPHWQGPFEVLSTTQHTLKLKNHLNGKTTSAHICNVKKFHDTPLTRYQQTDMAKPASTSTAPPPNSSTNLDIVMDDSPLHPGEYEVEEILSERLDQHNKREFLVKWKGYPASSNTWEPDQNFINSNGAKTLALIEWERTGRQEGIYQIIWGLEETNQRFRHLTSNLGRPAGTAA